METQPEIQIIYYRCPRCYYWTEEIHETELDSVLEEAQSRNEVERAKAISKAISKVCAKRAQLAFQQRLDAESEYGL